jgi:hypothetical protein
MWMSLWFIVLTHGTWIGTQQPPTELQFTPRRLMPKQDPILIDKYRIATIAEAISEVTDEELVLGVFLNGEARAYPLNRISGPKRELLNDKVGGQSIAVTWCSLCFSAVVFDRQTSAGLIDLGIAGSLWQNNMVMYDTKTQSLWSQIRGEAMSGQLKGTRLERLASDVMTWDAWKKEHPDTTVVLFPRTTDEFSRFPTSDRMSPVLAITSDLGSRMWEHSELQSQPMINDSWQGQALLVVRLDDTGAARVYSRRLDDRELTFVHRDNAIWDEQTQSTWDPRTGKATAGPLKGQQLIRLPTAVASRVKWQLFYPD